MEKKLNTLRIESNFTPVGTPGDGISLDTIRSQAQHDGAGFVQRTTDIIAAGGLTLAGLGSVRALQEALFDVDVPVRMKVAGGYRNVTTGAFPLLVGNLIIAAINEKLMATPTIGQELVTEMTDNKAVTTIAGIQTLGTDEEQVKEGTNYPEIGTNEETYEGGNRRNGRKLTITQETIDQNNVADIVNRVNALVDIYSEAVELLTLKRVTDYDGSAGTPRAPYALKLNGSNRQLYDVAATTIDAVRAPLGTRVVNNALVDIANLEAVRAVHAAMRNERGVRVASTVNQMQLLIPDALTAKVFTILNSLQTPGVENEQNPWGTGGVYRPQVVSSPRLDDLSSSAWYMGEFKKQFKRKTMLAAEQVILAGTGTQAYLDARIAWQGRIGWDIEVFANAFVHTVQSLSAEVAPADE